MNCRAAILLALLLPLAAGAQYPWSRPPGTNLAGSNTLTLWPGAPGLSNSALSNYSLTLSNLAAFLNSNFLAAGSITFAVSNSNGMPRLIVSNTAAGSTTTFDSSQFVTNGADVVHIKGFAPLTNPVLLTPSISNPVISAGGTWTNGSGIHATNFWVGGTNLHEWMANIETQLAAQSNRLAALEAATNALALATNLHATNFVKVMNGTAYHLFATNAVVGTAPMTVAATNGTTARIISVVSNVNVIAGVSNTGALFGMNVFITNSSAVSAVPTMWFGASAGNAAVDLISGAGTWHSRLGTAQGGWSVPNNYIYGMASGSSAAGADTAITRTGARSLGISDGTGASGNSFLLVSGITNLGPSYFSNLLTISGTNSLAFTNTGTNTTGAMSASPVGGETIWVNGINISFPIYSRP